MYIPVVVVVELGGLELRAGHAVVVEPVSTTKFPENDEKNSESCEIWSYFAIFALRRRTKFNGLQ
jgi:hypothetical protein